MAQKGLQLLKTKLFYISDLVEQVKKWRIENKKIVFTNGCFDLLHIGHITYLSEASSFGDKMIIGLNSDTSTKILKGPNRPVNDQNSRSVMLAAMYFVDAVILFDEDTPQNLITAILPDVLVKGGDYNIYQIVGGKEIIANGGDVKTIDFVEGHSSSLLIKKIQQNG